MVIIINLSRVCTELRPAILSLLSRQISKVNDIQDNVGEQQICILAEKADVPKIKNMIEIEFSRNTDFDDYLITCNNDNPSEIDILKKGDLEQLGLFICGFCPMIFQSEVEKNIKDDFSEINSVDLEAGANRCSVS